MELLRDIASDLVAGVVATAVIAGLVLLVRRVEPEAYQRLAERALRFGWPLLAFVFVASAWISAITRGATGLPIIVLGAFTAGALVLSLVLSAKATVLPPRGLFNSAIPPAYPSRNDQLLG